MKRGKNGGKNEEVQDRRRIPERQTISKRHVTDNGRQNVRQGGSYINSICTRGVLSEPQTDLLCWILNIDKKRLVIQEEPETTDQEPAAGQMEIITLLRQIDEKLLKLIYLISYKKE